MKPLKTLKTWWRVYWWRESTQVWMPGVLLYPTRKVARENAIAMTRSGPLRWKAGKRDE